MDNNYNNYNRNDNLESQNTYSDYGNYYTHYENPEPEYTEERFLKRKKRAWGKGIALVLVVAILVGLSGGMGLYIGRKIELVEKKEVVNLVDTIYSSEEAQTVEMNPERTEISISNTGDDLAQISVSTVDVSGVVENVMPSIVSITNVYDSTSNYFGRRYKEKNGGSGSGIIIGQNKEEILIVTNNHVSAMKDGGQNQKLTITFNDEKTAEATVKGADSSSDLAVVSVKVKDISKDTLKHIRIASLGDSKKMKVGQMVIAIGNALGYGQSTTVGYVSALNREVVTEDYTMKLIQTDAAINQGNSGGALLNAKGEVIGINSVKYAGSKIEGMGFAIPISTALPIVNDLMNREVISEGEQSYLGIMGQDITDNYSAIYGMPVGVYIVKVTENSPASKAGLKMGDIITEFNGYKIKSMAELQYKLAGIKGGKTVSIVVKQNKDGDFKDKKIDVTLGFRSEMKESFGKEERKNPEKEKTEDPDEFYDSRGNQNDFFGDEEDFFNFFFNR